MSNCYPDASSKTNDALLKALEPNFVDSAELLKNPRYIKYMDPKQKDKMIKNNFMHIRNEVAKEVEKTLAGKQTASEKKKDTL